MVDSPAAWMDELAHLRERVAALEEKLELKTDAMRVRVDREVVDISEAFAQQQKFTIELFHVLEQRIDRLEQRIDQRFAAVDRRFVALEAKMDAGFARLNERMNAFDLAFAAVDARFSRLESKLDLFIEAQTTFNQLVAARLRG